MIYSENSTGGAIGNGCSLVSHLLNFANPLEVGDIVYLKHRAIQGKLEKVYIKKILLNVEANSVLAKYIDSDNVVYFEGELLDYSAALVFARAFHVRNIDLLKTTINELC